MVARLSRDAAPLAAIHERQMKSKENNSRKKVDARRRNLNNSASCFTASMSQHRPRQSDGFSVRP
jgi:hypothetical protein